MSDVGMLAPFQRDEVFMDSAEVITRLPLNGIPIGIFYLWELNTKQSVSASKGQKKRYLYLLGVFQA